MNSSQLSVVTSQVTCRLLRNPRDVQASRLFVRSIGSVRAAAAPTGSCGLFQRRHSPGLNAAPSFPPSGSYLASAPGRHGYPCARRDRRLNRRFRCGANILHLKPLKLRIRIFSALRLHLRLFLCWQRRPGVFLPLCGMCPPPVPPVPSPLAAQTLLLPHMVFIMAG
ncbi:hypothetical protein GN956_G18029 [Arapaima gigas]